MLNRGLRQRVTVISITTFTKTTFGIESVLKNGRFLSEQSSSVGLLFDLAFPLLLLLPYFVVELIGFLQLFDFGFEERLCSVDTDFVHVDLREAGQLAQTRIAFEFTSSCFPENLMKHSVKYRFSVFIYHKLVALIMFLTLRDDIKTYKRVTVYTE